MSHLWDIWICQAEPKGYLDSLLEWDIYGTYGTCAHASIWISCQSLAKACVLGCLLPATKDPSRDLAIFEKLMAMDDESFVVRWKRRPKPKEILAKLSVSYITEALLLQALRYIDPVSVVERKFLQKTIPGPRCPGKRRPHGHVSSDQGPPHCI